jgi:NADH-ubiquinone oxidoreductase chain 6
MNNLIIINENITNGYQEGVLNIFYLFIILCSIFVIIAKNPVISVLFLIGLFSAVACYLIMIGLNFIGLSYIIVYVGAVSILFLFILMLINIRISELQNNTSNSIPLILSVLILFSHPLFQLLPYNPVL